MIQFYPSKKRKKCLWCLSNGDVHTNVYKCCHRRHLLHPGGFIPGGLACILHHQPKSKKMTNREIRELVYKAMYNRLREIGKVFGGRYNYPTELVDWIRATYPDEDQGAYDADARNTRGNELNDFFELDWGFCVC